MFYPENTEKHVVQEQVEVRGTQLRDTSRLNNRYGGFEPTTFWAEVVIYTYPKPTHHTLKSLRVRLND